MAVMTYLRPPPARKSLELTVTSKPDGPHHAEKPSAVVQASQTAPRPPLDTDVPVKLFR